MIVRVARLIRAEFIKIGGQRIFVFLIPALIVVTLGAAVGKPLAFGQKETEWARYNTFQLFSYGVSTGLAWASILILSYASLLFAGEFDRGTIKNLLTRPVSRTEVFASKVIVAFLLTLGLYGIVLLTAFLYGSLRGDLGPVWSPEQYEIKRTYAQMLGYTWNSVFAAVLPLLAVASLGILISTLADTSWYAVLIALILYFVLYFAAGFFPEKWQIQTFTYYLGEPFELLKRYAEGEGTLGYEPGHEKAWWKQGLHVKIPLLYIAGFLSTSYAVFRWKNVHA